MSWTFGNAGPGAPLQAQSQGAAAGRDLEEISTDYLGFLKIAGETKIQLLPQQWPSERLPPPTASLLSISSAKGLLAAAAVDSLIIATTESVRQAYTSDAPEENDCKPFSPLAKIQIPRVSQVSFSADGSCLVIAAEEGGGLAVYDVQALQQGQQQPSFQLATNGIPVRALVPNPAPESAHLFALVLSGGQLLLADLKERKLVAGAQGTYFREGASCVSWSAKGKQLVAGLGDGTAAQYDHQGKQQAVIPLPAYLNARPLPMTAIYWLANDDFLTVHTPVGGEQTDSKYSLLHRNKGSTEFTTSKFSDPLPAFGTRIPSHHFIARLRGFPPSLEDMLILSSTAGTDVGVFTKSTAPLTGDLSADKITNCYTTTSMVSDSRRAQMPMSADGMGDTSPIGMALDLTSKELVKRPIPSDDMEETSSPVPALMILDNEGRLSTWWIMYTDSIRQKTTYPGLAINAQGQSTATPAASAFQQTPNPMTVPPSAAPTSGSSSFGQPSKPASGSAGGGFGATSALGSKQSPWGATPQASAAALTSVKPAFGSTTAFGAASTTPAFGSASTPAAFGAASGLGAKSSLWGGTATTSGTSTAPAFGQTSAFGAAATGGGPTGFARFGSQSSPFASTGNGNESAPNPFGGFAGNAQNSSPFGALANTSAAPASSPFGTSGNDGKPTANPFGSFAGNAQSSSPFGAAKTGAEPSSSPFASSIPIKTASSPFASAEKPSQSPFASFGKASGQSPQGGLFASKIPTSNFGQPSAPGTSFSFGTPSAIKSESVSREADMTDGDDETKSESPQKPDEKPVGFGGFKLVSGFKGDGSAKDDLPASQRSGGDIFGGGLGSALGEAVKAPTTPIKQEPVDDGPVSSTSAAAPKPVAAKSPEASKPVDSGDAPLPPDFTIPSNARAAKDALANLPPVPGVAKKVSEPTKAEEAPLPAESPPGSPPALSNSDSGEELLPPIAGSPPVDLGGASSALSPVVSNADLDDDNEEAYDDEDGELDEEEDGDEDDYEGEDGEDEDDDIEGEDDEEAVDWEDESDEEQSDEEAATPQVTQQSIDKAKTSPFGARLSFPVAASEASQPRSPLPSTTPAGLPKGPIFAPPQKESPRSPSPVRTTSTPAARPPSRQVPSSPLVLNTRAQSKTGAKATPSLQPPKPGPPPPAELEDSEDVRIRALLESPIQPTKVLEPFIAHQDYIGAGDKPGLGGQVENIYRDVNSMIDTLGLNARSVESFVRGHTELRKQKGRKTQELDDEDDWCMVELDDLAEIMDKTGAELEQNKLNDISSLVSQISGLHTEALRLRTRTSEMRRQIALLADPEKRAAQRNAPLDTESEMQQTKLRRDLAQVQKLLQEAEEHGSVLRAELASAGNSGNDASEKGPTVEAVTNTILKMTAMIEQKSGDVDVLEAQIRRLPSGLASLSLDDDQEDMLRSSVSNLRNSRRGLPASRSMNALSTPAPARSLNRRSVIGAEKLGMSGMLGSRFRTPPQSSNRKSVGFPTSSPGESVLGASMISVSERKKMADVTREEVAHYNARVAHRRRILDALKKTVEEKGTRVVTAPQ